jgi:uncharacterized membrane protein YbhN (UPF0104 family)
VSDGTAAADGDIDLPMESVRPSTRKIITRALIMAVGIGVATALLVFAFDDLDLDAILDAIRSLTDAELLSLLSTTGIVIWAEALLLATFVPGLPARRGAMAWLGPTAVSSVVPGPSDLPMIYRMFTSWGQTGRGAATSVAAASLLNISLKLVLPAIAGIALAVADIPMEGLFSTIVTMTVILAGLLIIAAVVLGSERRTAIAGRALDRVWRPTLRLLRRDPPDRSLADRLVAQRAESIALLGGIWKKSVAAGLLVTAVRVALFVMCIRFVGVPESAASWVSVFCVWAIVRGLTVVPIMPGGVGVSELAYVGLLTPIAGSQYVNEITAGVLLYRILTWLLMIPAGAVAIGLWQVGLRRQQEATAG